MLNFPNIMIIPGVLLGVYEDNRFKTESKKPLLKSVDIIGLGAGPLLEKKLKHATDVCSGVILGRELVNAPANVLTPGLWNSPSHSFHSSSCVFLSGCRAPLDICKLSAGNSDYLLIHLIESLSAWISPLTC